MTDISDTLAKEVDDRLSNREGTIEIIDAKRLVNLDRISQNNGWETIRKELEKLKEQVDGNILLNFDKIDVSNPQQLGDFQRILKDNSIFMLFFDRENIVKDLIVQAIMDGFDKERFLNKEVPKINKNKSKTQMRVEEQGKDYLGAFKWNGFKYILDVKGYGITTMQSYNSVNYIEYAIRELNGKYGVKIFEINLDGVDMAQYVVNHFAELVHKLNEDGIKCYINLTDKEYVKYFQLQMLTLKNKELTFEDMEECAKAIEPNTCGMLLTYKITKSKDNYGRRGSGEVISSKIAIFRGYKDGIVTIDTFNNNYFYTQYQWMSEHDGETLDRLKVDTIKASLRDIGLMDRYIGVNYHFILPIQQSKTENTKVVYGINEEGNTISKDCSIPERMKIVFDSWGVEYNESQLAKAITETREIIGY